MGICPDYRPCTVSEKEEEAHRVVCRLQAMVHRSPCVPDTALGLADSAHLGGRRSLCGYWR